MRFWRRYGGGQFHYQLTVSGPADDQAQAAVAAAIGAVPKALEGLLAVPCRDAGPLVGNGHAQLPCRAHLQRHRAPLRAVADGIDQQVGEQPQQLLALSADRNTVVCRVGAELQVDPAVGGCWGIATDHILQQLQQIEDLQIFRRQQIRLARLLLSRPRSSSTRSNSSRSSQARASAPVPASSLA
jgi:hypothetical protein